MMDINTPVGMAQLSGTAKTGATILCYRCGAPIDGQTSTLALCSDCIKLTVDLTNGIDRTGVLNHCRGCDRWLTPPTSWIVAAPESRELLALCLKKIKGLNKHRLIDASFVWTEPHSKRIKVKITVQDAIDESGGVLIQQSMESVFTVAYQQCPECAKSYTANVWRASVQVRQKVLHKRTFLFLEQHILKHNAHRDVINIKEAKEGLDFFFAQRNQAEAFMSFLASVVPIESKTSKQIISEDSHTAKKSYKFTFSATIVPLCRDDLCALPLALAKRLGYISPLVLVHRIATSVGLLDPSTLQTAELSSDVYWRKPFNALCDTLDLVEFIVMDIERTGHANGRWRLAEAIVARASDLGVNDRTYFVRTHLGNLNVGDSAMGYMLTGANFNNTDFDELESSFAFGSTVPDAILVKRHYPNRRKNRRRNWKLKRMVKNEGELRPKKADQDRIDNEYEQFLCDLEEDKELRTALALYKNTKRSRRQQQDPDSMSIADTEITVDDDGPQVNMDELLENFDELDIEEQM